ncbi:MAG: alpha/beta hydrolase [Sedimenticola sp.]|nr:alpha/beta hydrolase [Sedimenticola sp.]
MNPLPTLSRVKLPDNRYLSYSLSGSPEGIPLLYCHGMPGSAYELAGGHDVALSEGVRLIVPERPGYGGSGLHPAYNLKIWAEDLGYLLEQLEISQLDLMGYSAGGAFALAAAHGLSTQVRRLTLVSSVAPYDFSGCFEGMSAANQTMIQQAREDLAQLAAGMAPLAAAPEQWLGLVIQGLAATDQALLLDQPGLYTQLRLNFQRSLQEGLAGMLSDLAILVTDWRYILDKIEPPVTLWQGGVDSSIPPVMAQILSEQLPLSERHIIPNSGHLLRYSHWAAILRRITDQLASGS